MRKETYKGNDRLLLGSVLAILTFWLFAQTTLNVMPSMRADLGIDETWSNMAVSITALFSGIFIVVLGGLGDKIGRVKMVLTGIVLSAAGSLMIALTPAGTSVFLMAGRIIQGLSAACIMPASLALIKAYYEGPARQRALSYLSMGSWGGSGLCSLFGGAVAGALGWRYIFLFSVLVSAAAFALVYGTPESRVERKNPAPFDWFGLVTFMISMVALNIVIGQGARMGWGHPVIIVLILTAFVGSILFFKEEMGNTNPFIDFKLFRNKSYAGATLSNFLLNGSAGTIMVTLTLLQLGAGMSSFTAGLVTLGYLAAVLLTIRVGEKLLRLWGARKPMILGCLITSGGIILLSLSFLYTWQYLVAAFLGFTLFGVGLGLYATPSADAALSNVPADQAGSAAGLYKMASSLGAAFGVAISASIFTALSGMEMTALSGLFLGRTDNVSLRLAAMAAFLFNFLMIMATITSIVNTIPKKEIESEEKSEDLAAAEG